LKKWTEVISEKKEKLQRRRKCPGRPAQAKVRIREQQGLSWKGSLLKSNGTVGMRRPRAKIDCCPNHFQPGETGKGAEAALQSVLTNSERMPTAAGTEVRDAMGAKEKKFGRERVPGNEAELESIAQPITCQRGTSKRGQKKKSEFGRADDYSYRANGPRRARLKC